MFSNIARSLVIILLVLYTASTCAEEIDYPEGSEFSPVYPIVVLAALDKITTQLTTIEIRQDQTVQFGTLEITLRQCRSNPPEKPPESVAFLEIVDVGHNNQRKTVFTGWMFASSPALSPLEHPVYDVWVKDCKMPSGPQSTGKE